jgi:N-acetylglucosaminyl-diphospho-decaprenol L-rhamnosyltransferase
VSAGTHAAAGQGVASPASPSLSVVVVNWNGAAYLGACLDSARGAGRELIVVDNASSDASRALVRERHPDVVLLSNERNVGFAAAANRGLAAARGPFVLFLNPDARANDGAIDAALAVVRARPEVGLVGVAQRDASGALTPTVEPFFSLAALRRPWHRRVRAPGGDHPVDIDWCHGAFLLGRRDELAALGGFDEAYFLYAEDMDLCFRVHGSGKRVVYLPQVSIVHDGNRAGATLLGERRAAAIFASCLVFHRRRRGRAATALLRVLATIAFGLRALSYRIAGSPLAERYAALAGVALRGRLSEPVHAMHGGARPAVATGKP